MDSQSSSTIRPPKTLPPLLYAIPVALTLALLACAGQLSVEVEKAVTPEVEVTPTAESTATPSPVPAPTAVPTATLAPEKEEQPPLEIPDRGYNSVGSPDAPVTLLDFSDFT